MEGEWMFWDAFIFKRFCKAVLRKKKEKLNCLEQKRHLKAAWPPERSQAWARCRGREWQESVWQKEERCFIPFAGAVLCPVGA